MRAGFSEDELPAVGVSREDEVDAVVLGGVEGVRVVCEEESEVVAVQSAAGAVDESAEFVVVFGPVDACDGEGVASCVDICGLVDEEVEPASLEGPGDGGGVVAVVVVSEDGVDAERSVEAGDRVDDLAEVAVGVVEHVAGVGDQVGSGEVDRVDDGAEVVGSQESADVEVGEVCDAQAVEVDGETG